MHSQRSTTARRVAVDFAMEYFVASYRGSASVHNRSRIPTDLVRTLQLIQRPVFISVTVNVQQQHQQTYPPHERHPVCLFFKRVFIARGGYQLAVLGRHRLNRKTGTGTARSVGCPEYSSHIFSLPPAPGLIGCSSSMRATLFTLTGVDDEFGIGQSTTGAVAILRLGFRVNRCRSFLVALRFSAPSYPGCRLCLCHHCRLGTWR